MQKQQVASDESLRPFEDSFKDLGNKPVDYGVSVGKAIVGLHPQFGPALSELIALFPGQRLDRVVEYLKTLDARVVHVERETIQLKLSIEAFQVLFEESITAASKATSDERRSYIASIVAGDIDSPDVGTVDYENKRRMLAILEQVNDIEILWLMFFSKAMYGRGEEFYGKHKHILGPGTISTPELFANPFLELDDDRRESAEMHNEYREHLHSLRLLRKNYDLVNKDQLLQLPVFNQEGQIGITGYEATHFGRLFLKMITDGKVDDAEEERRLKSE